MTEPIFAAQKDNLILRINKAIAISVNPKVKQDLEHILKTLQCYSFENRLQLKGTLTHTIVDSLQLEYDLGEKLIEFDQNIK